MRDEAIRECDRNFTARHPQARRWQSVVGSMSPQQSVLELAPDIVDLTLWKLLGAIDDGLLALYFAADGEAPVALEDAGNGEMLGRYVDDAEWLARYAAERYYPYISNTFALEMPSDERDDGRRN